jgi:hypothetical protein
VPAEFCRVVVSKIVSNFSRDYLVGNKSKVPIRRIIMIEQARTDAEFLEWVRIAYALGIEPSKLAEAQEEIEKNLSQGKTGPHS